MMSSDLHDAVEETTGESFKLMNMFDNDPDTYWMPIEVRNPTTIGYLVTACMANNTMYSITRSPTLSIICCIGKAGLLNGIYMTCVPSLASSCTRQEIMLMT